MELNALTAISPVDGRYRTKTVPLDEYFSEFALIRYRVRVEIEYFIALCELPLPELSSVPHELFGTLRALYEDFTEADARRVKEIEAVTNHDVKAVEYFIKEKYSQLTSGNEAEFFHFGLTSQDINNTAVPLSLKEAMADVYLPLLHRLIDALAVRAAEWKDVPMLARTHGQPASPTRLGKELRVFVYRLERQLQLLEATPLTAKLGGATGNFNAHHVAYPDVDWQAFADRFVGGRLGLERERWTTQISNYDCLAAVLDALRRINTVVVDLDRDLWQYVSMGYFRQRVKAGEVGSSAMPHKVNPIDFENSEGNLGVANALLSHIAQKLPVSRLQRDLTDSTVLRDVGMPLAHTVIAFESTLKGLGKLLLCQEALQADLDQNWAVVAEALQTILRREGYPKPYEALKALTRTGEAVSRQRIADFIETLDVAEDVKKEMRQITPSNYTGIA